MALRDVFTRQAWSLPPSRRSLAAAAQLVRSNEGIQNRAATPQALPWQDEVWKAYDEQGEFGYAVTWKANMVSRVRLRAAKVTSGSDEPSIDKAKGSVAADLVDMLFGGIGGKAAAMQTFETHLQVPGESWMLIEQDKGGMMGAQVLSADEIRAHGDRTQVIDEYQSGESREVWRELDEDGEWMLVRLHRPHRRKRHMADSPARRARGILRELELVNRHITAQYLSRLASAGIVIFPQGVDFPVRKAFADKPNGFVLEWIEVAREGIAEPGAASAVVPIPMKLPPDVIDKVKHIDFTVKIDDKIIDKRESAIRRLALQVDVPPEILLGMATANHWGAWQIEEGAVKAHLLPDVELIVGDLTTGWLWPLLRSMGVVDPEQWVVWYDASEIILRPDHSDNAMKLYDRGELSGPALRRETGMDETDKPTPEEFERIMLMRVALTKGDWEALSRLLGMAPPPPAAPGGGMDEPDDEDNQNQLPGTRDEPPPPPDADQPLRRLDYRTMTQRRAVHYLQVQGTGTWLRHPTVCVDHERSCPFTVAVTRAMRNGGVVTPGQTGYYHTRLTSDDKLAVGPRFHPSQSELLPATEPIDVYAEGVSA